MKKMVSILSRRKVNSILEIEGEANLKKFQTEKEKVTNKKEVYQKDLRTQLIRLKESW